MTIRDHIDKAGILGATVAALCCLGAPAILAVLTAVGLGFLIHDAILLPLLAVSLVLTLWGLYAGWRRHRHAAALVLGTIASAALVTFTFAYASRPLAIMSIALLVIASLINVALLRSSIHGGTVAQQDDAPHGNEPAQTTVPVSRSSDDRPSSYAPHG